MSVSRIGSLRLGFALLVGVAAVGGALALAPSALAQAAPTDISGEDPGSALSRHLRTLADQPQSLVALVGAGEAALALGDAQAALTFFARAEEIAPRDGRVKAGMGSAFLQMEKPREAMKFFGEAQALGVPEAEFAGDRGLAHDLDGNPRRAQADYALALRHGEDAEVRRRLALSLAISGERDRALAAIDAQLRRQDRAAWRTRAFILALTGDVTEATRGVEAAMPAQAGQMRPFLARLATLSSAQRAMAVHFGTIPADAAPVRIADASTYARPVTEALTDAGKPDARQPALGRAQPIAPSPAQPVVQAPPAASIAPPPASIAPPAASISPLLRQVQGAPDAGAPSQAADVGGGMAAAARPSLTLTPPPSAAAPRPGFASVAQLVAALPAAGSAAPPPERKPAPVAEAKMPFKKAVPADPPGKPDTKAVQKREEAPKKAAAAKKAEPAAKEPSRIWIQIAGGADRKALPREYARLQAKAPKLLAGKSAWTTPLRFTNRLLVGPFKTEKEAQTLVNALNKLDFDAFSWTSPAGQEIEKLPAR